MHRNVYYIVRHYLIAYCAMATSCLVCGYRLQSEICYLGPFSYVVYFDDDKESATYTERVKRCPECGVGRLGGGGNWTPDSRSYG
jgi:hypothetical protein